MSNLFSDATDREIEATLLNAKKCFNTFRKLKGSSRAKFLNEIIKELNKSRKRIISVAQSETSLGQNRLEMEFTRTVGEIKIFANLAITDTWRKVSIQNASLETCQPRLHTENIALGPVLVIGACNFPLAISVVGTDTISALAVGCPVIIKAHPSHPQTCQLLAQLVQRAMAELKIPEGVFQLIHGESHTVTQKLVTHHNIACIAFTGSLTGGTTLSRIVSKRKKLIPFHAEMGSLNPVIALPTKIFQNHQKLAFEYVQSVNLFAGQMCTKPGVLFLLKSSKNESFISAVREAVSQQNALPMLNEDVFMNYENGIDFLKKELTLIATNETENQESQNLGYCRIFETSSIYFLQHQELTVETFGPASIIVHCQDEKELNKCVNNLQGSLTGSIFVADEDRLVARNIIPKLESTVGRLLWNGFPPGVTPGIATQHGGPWPATTDSRHTSIGREAYRRFVRPVCRQGFPVKN
ncbi:MAG: aldehyde dehydrogenase family protein [Opitutae bacterium]|nr:aldehyde dehydrogenase family protein [Opitutae bacterium]